MQLIFLSLLIKVQENGGGSVLASIKNIYISYERHSQRSAAQLPEGHGVIVCTGL